MSFAPAGEVAAAPPPPATAIAGSTRRPRGKVALGRITSRLTVINISIGLVGVVTGPLQARALGPAGRGELAAILTPFTFLPTLASIGLGSYAIRAVARGRRPGEAFGSLLPVTLALGVLVAGLSPLLAGLLAGGRAVVYTMLIVGLLTFPLGMVGNLLVDVAVGSEDWRPVTWFRTIPPVLQLVGIPALFWTGHLTVTSAAVIAFSGGVLSLLPLARLFTRCRPLEFNPVEMKAGIAYGAKCWVGGLSNLGNARLDQLLMIRLVSSSVLGLYAIAVTLSTFFVSPVVGAISTAANARMARGDDAITRRLCRMTLFGAAAAGVCVGALSPLVLRYVFGPAFSKALPMTLILLAAGVPNAAGGILNTSVSAAGHPGLPARGEGIALVVTVAGLVIALPLLGGVGAALVSAAAYSTQFGYMLMAARRVHGGSYREYLLLDLTDFELIRSYARGRLVRLLRVKAGRTAS